MFLRPATNLINISRSVKRWVAPTLREIRKRKQNPKLEIPKTDRTKFIDWNYNAELFAFSKRLNENFDLKLLQTAFTQRSYATLEKDKQIQLGIYDENMIIEDNKNLIAIGDELLRSSIYNFLKKSLKQCPDEGLLAIRNYLISDDMLAYLASNLGMEELILSGIPEETEKSKYTRSDTFKAVIGALIKSSGAEQAESFIRDFVCTQLNQIDLTDIWKVTNPLDTLKKVCHEKNLGEPEPRLLGDTGKNTILGAFYVGIYDGKKQLLGEGFGENVDVAIEAAARDSLAEMYKIKDNKVVFKFRN